MLFDISVGQRTWGEGGEFGVRLEGVGRSLGEYVRKGARGGEVGGGVLRVGGTSGVLGGVCGGGAWVGG